MVECLVANENVASSSLVSRSTLCKTASGFPVAVLSFPADVRNLKARLPLYDWRSTHYGKFLNAQISVNHATKRLECGLIHYSTVRDFAFRRSFWWRRNKMTSLPYPTVRHCPHCNRRLVSQRSARCNWCGREIENADYQIQADIERVVFLQKQREHEAKGRLFLSAACDHGGAAEYANARAAAKLWMGVARCFLELLSRSH